jgi:hypothetical protein
MGDIELSFDQELDANLAREQDPPDNILSQLALATIMLRLELDLRAFVRTLNATKAAAAPVEQAPHRLSARLLQRFASINNWFSWQPTNHRIQPSPRLT